ncbi:MAG: hypothetical protein QOK24_1139 [Verrucomicrobiota bacterium]
MRVPTTRTWVTIASFLVFIGTVNTLVVQRHPAATLTIDMQSSVTSHAKVFFDTGEGFTESDSVLHWVIGGRDSHRLVFPFPARTVRNIRFDPIETTGVVEVRSAVIERPRSHEVIRKFDLARISPLNQVASISLQDGTLRVTTVGDANDSQLLLPVETPVTAYYSAAQLLSWKVLRLDALWLLAALGLGAAARYRRGWGPFLGVINQRFDAWSAQLRRPGIFQLDRIALWYYTLCLIVFVALSVARLHSSSISIAGASYHGWTDVVHKPLLGTPKHVRSDEWGFHTPAILNQALRSNRLSVFDSSVGPGKAALLGNIPCWHFTQLFRPQFWSFFCLPVDFAFSFYWQAKALILLTGVFTLLLLLTRSSAVSAIGALWYFFSAYTQWAYSWASLLPEMVGLFCWVISLTCYLLLGRNKVRLLGAAVVCAACAINFALCAYPPHQIPLIVFGVAIILCWLWSHRSQIWRREFLLARFLALAGCWGIVGLVMFWFYLDAKETLVAAAGTVYPGHRLSSGGDVPVSQLLSHFLDFWKSENSFPSSQGNICESSGYFWLAPLTLLMGWRPAAFRPPSALQVCLWTSFLFLLCWMLIPIPAAIGRWMFFDMVPSYRCYHALGLINIAIVGVFLAERPAEAALRLSLRNCWGICAVVVLPALLLFSYMNGKLNYFFSIWALGFASIYLSLLVLSLARRRLKIFALILLVPLVLANGLINPVDRGLDVITSSSLFKALQNDESLRLGKWLIYAPWADEPAVLSATGIDVLDTLKIVPERARLAPFDPENRYQEVINRSCYLMALPLGGEEASSFQTAGPGNVLWKVSPADLRLNRIGVRHVAFAYEPPPTRLSPLLAPRLETALPGLSVYRLP